MSNFKQLRFLLFFKIFLRHPNTTELSMFSPIDSSKYLPRWETPALFYHYRKRYYEEQILRVRIYLLSHEIAQCAFKKYVRKYGNWET